MAKLTEQGRIRLAMAIQKLPIYMAWGNGYGAWDSKTHAERAETVHAQDSILRNPRGLLKVREVAYVTPVPDNRSAAEIDVDTGRFNRSASKGTTPTKHLYLRFQSDFEDALEEVIREIGVYVGIQIEGEPMYVDLKKQTPTDDGDLMLLEHRRPIHRDKGVRAIFEFVVTF
jgi:hypothetical protein